MKFSRPVLLGSTYMIGSTVAFTVLGFIVKMLGDHLPGLESLFIRSFISALVLIPLMRFKRISIVGKHHRALITRGLLGMIAAFGYFYGITIVPAAEAVSLFRSSALFMPFLAFIFLKEKFSPVRAVLALVGFVGVCLILKPGFAMHGPGPWILLGGAIFNALSMISIRSLTNRENAATIVFYFSVCAALGSWALAHQTFVTPSLDDWKLLALMSVLGLIGQGLMTVAYHHADATIVTPIGYLEILIMALLGWGLLDELPDQLSVLGMVLIIAASVLIIRNGSIAARREVSDV